MNNLAALSKGPRHLMSPDIAVDEEHGRRLLYSAGHDANSSFEVVLGDFEVREAMSAIRSPARHRETTAFSGARP